MTVSLEDTLHIAGDRVGATSPEGVTMKMPLAAFLQRLAPPCLSTGDLVLPNGWRAIFTREPMMIIVHESPPQVLQVEWIRDDSPAPYGRSATYQRRTLSFPYQLLFCVFGRDRMGRMMLSRRNELFWSTRSLGGAWDRVASPLDDPSRLKYPALLNVSRYEEIDMRAQGKSLAWLCTQTFDERDRINQDEHEPRRIVRAVNGLVQFVRASRFNLSSEFSPAAHNSRELRSWFTESASIRKIDRRLETVAAWERATLGDPAFIFEVPFLPVGLSIRQVAERIFDMYAPPTARITVAADLARIVFNHREDAEGTHGYQHSIF